MASESDSTEQSETFNDTKFKESKTNEESVSLKRSFEGNSDFQPEAKKIAMSNENSSGVGDSKPSPMPVQQSHPLNSNPQGHITEEMRVPDRMVGLLIGKGGEQITNIQNDCQCRIQFASSKPGTTDRDCAISGPAANVMKAKRIIDDIVFRNQLVLLGGDEGYLDIYVPGNKVGLIIGKNGDTIKQLQEKSGVRIAVIQSNTDPSQFEKPVRITGNKQGIQHARELLMEKLNEHDKTGAPNTRTSYGGGGGGGNKMGIQIPVPRSLVGIVIGKGGEMIKKIQEDSGAKVQFKPDDIADEGPSRICHVYGFKQNNEIATQMIHELIKQGMHRMNGGMDIGHFRSGPSHFANGTSHSIPADKCGLVIGKGGENIKEINKISGAHAELIRENNSDPSIKRFRIQGTPDQVQHCIQLMNEKAGLPPPLVGGHVYGGIQGSPMPPMVAQFPTLNMPGPAGGMVAPFQGQTQVVLPNATVYGAPQAQWANPAAAYQHGTQAAFGQPQAAATVVVDPTKTDPNLAAWSAYYSQVYGGGGAVAGQQGGGPAVAGGPHGGVQAIPTGQVGAPSGAHQAVAYTTQMIPAQVQAAAQPQPTINPITGQHDYSLAWAEYYRAQGMHQQAAAIMQGAGMPASQ